MGRGFLKINLFVGDQVLPVNDMKVLVKDTKGNILYELITDENGLTKEISLDAPDKNASKDPYSNTPDFSTYDVEVPSAKGYKKTIVYGVQIFDTITSILPIQLHPVIKSDMPEENTEEIYIPYEHGVDLPKEPSNQNLQGEPPNQPETLPYNYDFSNTGDILLANEVKIPEYITVHLGSPNAIAENVRVPFKDYIKNVASSEIFPTWDEAALYANIYSQISFALNRTYTVWYRSRGFDFDITNSTAFDQYFVPGRNFFDNISRIVDRIFNNFLRRPGRREPFFAQYCNGTTSKCDGLSQWGSQDLAAKGYTPIQILRYYFPNDINIVESNNFTQNVSTFPGTALKEGSTGEDVRKMQTYLNRISGNFYIPAVGIPDGRFGSATKASVIAFQQLFNLVPDGIIGKSTWYQITKIYVAVKELAELTSEGERLSIGATPPTVTIQMNSRGEYVVELQFLLNYIAQFYNEIPFVIENGVFRDDTKRSVVEFQKKFGLTPDGVVGPGTWNKLYEVYWSLKEVTPPVEPPYPSVPPFPGTALRIGSSGSNVLLMQNYLNAISRVYPSIPSLVADGLFGSGTQASVIAFQRQFGLTADGVIGQQTWYKIIDVYNNLPAGGAPPFPGTNLTIGSRGDNVLLMQNYLNALAKVFPVIPALTADGIFGSGTAASVRAFQTLFGLTADGVIGRNTWDKIVSVYNNKPTVAAPQYPGAALRVGSRGNDVIIMQKYLNTIAGQYPSVPNPGAADGIFGAGTEKSVIAFQKLFGLTADGVIGRNTWNQIVSVYNKILMGASQVNAFSTGTVGGGNNVFDKYAMLLALSMFKRY